MRLVEFPLDQGGSIVVEVDEPGATAGLERAGRPGEIVERASASFGAALEHIKPAAAEIIAKLRSLVDAPDEVAVEFGVKLNGKLGIAVVAATEAEANFKVVMTWRNQAGGPAQTAEQ